MFLILLIGLNVSAAPAYWIQMNDDGFFGHTATDTNTELFVFGSDLYAYDSLGFYQMQTYPCLEWKQLTVPVAPGEWTFRPLGGLLFLSKGDQLWFITAGTAFTKNNWVKVNSIGPAQGTSTIPMALFNGQIYAAVNTPGKYYFDIWRSSDIGKPTMQWSQVVSNGFNDPQNRALAFMPIFNNKIMAVTTETRTSVFGNPSGFGSGIEVWESANGDMGSWTQVNKDGFGTEVTLMYPTKQTFRINQDAGCWAVYKGLLYIGTKTHWGAEVWRYDGTGLNGWTKVTPPWAGPCDIGCGPGRNNAMIEFENYLFLGEGFPTGALSRYDGTKWTLVADIKDFDKSDAGFSSLATLNNKLYVATLHEPYTGNKVRGDQVWGYPFVSYWPSKCNWTYGGPGEDKGRSVQQTKDGSYIVAGYITSYYNKSAGFEDVWLIRTDQNGDKLWDKTFGGPAYDEGYSAQQTKDGGYIIAGWTYSYGAGDKDIWLIKTDQDGNKLWDKTFGGPSGDEGHFVQQTSDDGYIITGGTNSYGNSWQVWLIKTDQDGNKQWDKTFGGQEPDGGYSVQQTSDGGYIIAGYTQSYGADGIDIWLIKTDSNGNELWNKRFGGADFDWGYSVQQTSDGGYILTGDKTVGESQPHIRNVDLWLIKTDSNGNKLWDKTFGALQTDAGYSVQQTDDGGYIITGSTESYGVIDIWLIKTDSNGNKLWDKTFGGSGWEEGNSIQQTNDGGYIIAGSTWSYGAGGSDIYLIKTDSTGNKK